MLTKEQLQELETKHKRIYHARGKIPPPTEASPKPDAPWECVFRAPTRGEYQRFRAMAHNPNTVDKAQENLARTTVVHPTKDEFDTLLETYPAIPEAVAKAISNIAGMELEEEGK